MGTVEEMMCTCVWVLQSGHRSDGCDLASTLCKYNYRKGDLIVRSWERVQRSREMLMCGGSVSNIL